MNQPFHQFCHRVVIQRVRGVGVPVVVWNHPSHNRELWGRILPFKIYSPSISNLKPQDTTPGFRPQGSGFRRLRNLEETVIHSTSEIKKAIEAYALAYGTLQEWQEKSPLIPIGDQKTGCIGEFYVYLYLTEKYPEATLTYGGHSEKGWDLLISSSDKPEVKIQVKTVSAYSATRSLSPIHPGWDEIHVVYLNRMFQPEGFWIVRASSMRNITNTLKGKKCPAPGRIGTGSMGIPFGENLVDDLNRMLAENLYGDE